MHNFVSAFSLFGKTIPEYSLNILLPVGISFYTFQTLSYTIDVYRQKIQPTHDFIAFSAFISFFPQLVAGPIERSTHLLPQFYTRRFFDYSVAVNGMHQILWGLFKKIVIADNCAYIVNYVFSNYHLLSGSTLFFGALFFAFQIYGDFSGYSDIAIGVAKLFGFTLMQNFKYPYFSRNIGEFWRCWHISLTTWFRDYLYIPLGGSRGSTFHRICNTFIIFIVSGFWHGAKWTFIAWGFLNALYFLPLLLTNTNRSYLNIVADQTFFPSIKELSQMGMTFILVAFSWIFFRAESMNVAFSYISIIFSKSLFTIPDNLGGKLHAIKTVLLIMIFLSIEWVGRHNHCPIEYFTKKTPFFLRYVLYYAILFCIFWFHGKEQEFIYFQF